MRTRKVNMIRYGIMMYTEMNIHVPGAAIFVGKMYIEYGQGCMILEMMGNVPAVIEGK